MEGKRVIRGALWDLDGTLLDTEPIYFNSYAAAAAALDRPNYTFEEVHVHLLGRQELLGAANFLRILKIEGMTPHELIELRDKFLVDLMPSAGPLPGAMRAVECFKGKMPIALATSSMRSQLPLKQQNNQGLFDLFDAIICGDDDACKGKGKPDPAIFLHAASQIGIPAHECVAFEDSIAGVMSAKAAGCFVVGIPDSRLDMGDFLKAGPDVVLKSLEDFDPSCVGL
jgi:beta-phosphoglucomutase-like phosphatase (HAD superfamily)